MLRTPHFSTRAALLLEQQMNLGWKPDAAVSLLVLMPAGVDIISATRHQPLLLSHCFIDPFHDPQNVAPNTINSTLMVSWLARCSQLSNQHT